jgi:hypothetical protein
MGKKPRKVLISASAFRLASSAARPRSAVYVFTEGRAYWFYGCSYGQHTPIDGTWTHVKLTAVNVSPADPAQPVPVGTVSAIEIVADEGTDITGQGTPGSSIIDNITVNGIVLGKPGGEK